MNTRAGACAVLCFCLVAAGLILASPQVLAPGASIGDANDVRRTVAQVFGGAFAIAAGCFAWMQLELARDKAITERFSKAADSLGSDNLHVRIGAIYALERIAHESRRDHWPIMEVLTAFVRNWKYIPDSDALETEDFHIGEGLIERPSLRADVQAAMDVLGRRRLTHEKNEELDLSEVYLPGVKLRGVFARTRWVGASVRYGDLTGVNFTGADLSRISVVATTVARCNFSRANLGHASLYDARDLPLATWTAATVEEMRVPESERQAMQLTQSQRDSLWQSRGNRLLVASTAPPVVAPPPVDDGGVGGPSER